MNGDFTSTGQVWWFFLHLELILADEPADLPPEVASSVHEWWFYILLLELILTDEEADLPPPSSNL